MSEPGRGAGPDRGAAPLVVALGLACVDVVLEVGRRPAEDEEARAAARRVARGGNASSTLAVLAASGAARCAFVGAFAGREASRAVTDDLEAAGVRVAGTFKAEHEVPTSYITASRQTGSRTIVHYRGALPEMTADEFFAAAAAVEGAEGAAADWFHIEPRVMDEALRVLGALDARRPRPSVLSVEVEKPKHWDERLLALADVVFVSKEVARHLGFGDGRAALEGLPAARRAGQLVTCAWGADGAGVRDASGAVHWREAVAPVGGSVVDSVGAGDAFHAGFIAARLRGAAPADAVGAGVLVAGHKVGQVGFAGLGAVLRRHLQQQTG